MRHRIERETASVAGGGPGEPARVSPGGGRSAPETRRQGDKETRRQGDKETRRQGDKETRRQGDKETRRQGGDKETRRQGDRGRPGKNT
ncbi:MAG: hypothetical protein IPO81_25340 [Kouleothrix sp.]|nr:hypothetical protein [Kouleothrix sp.]